MFLGVEAITLARIFYFRSIAEFDKIPLFQGK